MPAFAQDQGADKAADRTLKGDAVCTACHDESEATPILAMYSNRRHGNKADERTPGCQTCHGASQAHIKSSKASPDVIFGDKAKAFPVSSAENQVAVCLTCHKDSKRNLWQGSPHQSRDITCTSCHSNHSKGGDPVVDRATQTKVCFTCHKTQRAENLRMSTHPTKAGKVICSDCHNPHGSEGPKQVKEITIRDTCFTCHAEKRGPFLHEHPSAMDDCMNCHTPHGSTNAPLLKARSPWLCQSCHGEWSRHPGNMYSAAGLPKGRVAMVNTQNPVLNGTVNPVTGNMITQNVPQPQLGLRGCVNCHSAVHGSNHPGGLYLVR